MVRPCTAATPADIHAAHHLHFGLRARGATSALLPLAKQTCSLSSSHDSHYITSIRVGWRWPQLRGELARPLHLRTYYFGMATVYLEHVSGRQMTQNGNATAVPHYPQER